MEKIYGYKEQDVLGLAGFLKDKGNASLTEVFESYAKASGKAKGTVRNLYYALAKASQKDKEIRDRFLGGKSLSVSNIVTFDEKEEKELVKKILIGKKQGRSVRSVINEMANGDGKLALRYQNKFRGALKTSPEWLKSMIDEINQKFSGKELYSPEESKGLDSVSDKQFNKLKTQINLMVSRIAREKSRENGWLKERIALLEMENIRLKTALYGAGGKAAALKFFADENDKFRGNGGGEKFSN